jgi:hypothetical protein
MSWRKLRSSLLKQRRLHHGNGLSARRTALHSWRGVRVRRACSAVSTRACTSTSCARRMAACAHKLCQSACARGGTLTRGAPSASQPGLPPAVTHASQLRCCVHSHTRRRAPAAKRAQRSAPRECANASARPPARTPACSACARGASGAHRRAARFSHARAWTESSDAAPPSGSQRHSSTRLGSSAQASCAVAAHASVHARADAGARLRSRRGARLQQGERFADGCICARGSAKRYERVRLPRGGVFR